MDTDNGKQDRLQGQKYLYRSKQLLQSSQYRLRLGFFIILGAALVMAALLVKDPFFRDILIQVAIVFITVGLVDFLWDFVGGNNNEIQTKRVFDELQNQIANGFSAIDERVDDLQRSVQVLSDIGQKNIGIYRIWPNRKAWEDEALNEWKEILSKADHIDVVSNTFWTRWFVDPTFRDLFFKAIVRGAKTRLVVYDPGASILEVRARDERDPGSSQNRPLLVKPTTQMQIEITQTLERLAEGWEKLPKIKKENLKIRTTTDYYHLAQIIRADNRMVVATYLSGKAGTPSPTMELRGEDSEYFKTYLGQVEIIFNRAKVLSEAELIQYLPNR